LGGLRETRQKLEKINSRIGEQLNIAGLILEKAQDAVRKYDSDFSAMENVAADELAVMRLDGIGVTTSLEGYLGPLNSLISYDPKYSKAIAAVGRDWLNAIVVRDVPSLLRLTEASRKLRISRLTVIPLSEVGGFESGALPEILGVQSPISELISAEPRMRDLLNFIFGDSVLVSSAKDGFVAAKKGFRAVTLKGDVFEPDVLAFETGYAARYTQFADLLGQQETYDGIKTALASMKTLIEKRKSSIHDIRWKTHTQEAQERAHELEVSKIESRIETTRQMAARFVQDESSMKQKLVAIEQEILRTKDELARASKLEYAYKMGSEKLGALVSSIERVDFDSKLSEIASRRREADSKIEQISTEILDSSTEITKVRAELENNLKPSLERLMLQWSETETRLRESSQFLADSEPRLQQLESDLASLRERESETLDRAAKYQPKLDSIEQKIRELKSEQEIVRKSLTAAERETFSLNTELTKLTDTERILVGDLAMNGYADPIEAFEGADGLLSELNSEYNSLRNNVNFNADRNYREIFENYKYSSVRRNELEKERNAIVLFIDKIDAEKRKVFMDAFERIDKELRVIFTKITGGNAWLEIERPDSIFDSGVFLMAQFPGKLPRDSSSVSGGEKTMSALSFILAIQAVFPSPFYVFDEVDAHLDSLYSGKLAEILAERCVYSQIIIVSLKDTVVSKAGSVIGVYMDHGSSRVIRYKSGMEVELRNE
jgi:chromosome segregation protein